ncbi:MAG: flavodoxin family protein [Candidatus Bathyarchaeota archaeon]|jgi:multimeric flavodoxin WrbA|nr:MAG: flavodoxin family protein [Candidatus Bathyarchaeota archaeon]
MKTVVFHGSPRKDGNSDTLAKSFVDGLRANGNGEIKEFYANDLCIKPCQMCESCSKPERVKLAPNNCVIRDDMEEIYPAFAEADVVVFATPIIWGYMTAQLKAILDRMEAIASNRYFGGKAFVVIITCWHHYQTLVAFFKRAIADYYDDVKLHTIIYCSLDPTSKKDVHVSNCKQKLEEAYNLGRNLGNPNFSAASQQEN